MPCSSVREHVARFDVSRRSCAICTGGGQSEAAGARNASTSSSLVAACSSNERHVEAAVEEAQPPPTDGDLAELAGETASIIRNGNRRQVKGLLQALVQRIEVESRTHIQPIFFVPAVRPPDGSVPPA